MPPDIFAASSAAPLLMRTPAKSCGVEHPQICGCLVFFCQIQFSTQPGHRSRSIYRAISHACTVRSFAMNSWSSPSITPIFVLLTTHHSRAHMVAKTGFTLSRCTNFIFCPAMFDMLCSADVVFAMSLMYLRQQMQVSLYRSRLHGLSGLDSIAVVASYPLAFSCSSCRSVFDTH